MSSPPICQRCRKPHASVVSRKECFCDDCFRKFVSQKQRKQMMSDPYFQDIFKVAYRDKLRTAEEADLQNAQSNILVALSFGSSSLVMLDILNDTLSEQKHTQRGNTGFQVDVIVCFQTEQQKNELQLAIDELCRGRFASNIEKFKFHLVDLNAFYCSSSGDPKILILDDRDFSVLESDYKIIKSGEYSIAQLLEQCPDRTSREDALSFIKKHIIKKFAYQNNHKAILWGHSMTKLADETISLVVKGRGSQIAPTIDSATPDGDYEGKFRNLFPLRDVLLSEVDAYCCVSGLDKHIIEYVCQDTLLIHKINTEDDKTFQRLIKSMTINEIARKYFDDIEGDYSNVISTVVRTADKLAEPVSAIGTEKIEKCRICMFNIHANGSEWLGHITVNEGHPLEDEREAEVYEKWKASKTAKEVQEYQSLRSHISAHGETVLLCYGCVTNLNRMKDRSLTWPSQSKSDLDCILHDYALTDTEN